MTHIAQGRTTNYAQRAREERSKVLWSLITSFNRAKNNRKG